MVYEHTHTAYKQIHSMTMALKFHGRVKSQPPIKTYLELFPTPPNNALISAGYSDSTQFRHHLPGDSINYKRLRVQSYETALQALPHP